MVVSSPNKKNEPLAIEKGSKRNSNKKERAKAKSLLLCNIIDSKITDILLIFHLPRDRQEDKIVYLNNCAF